MPSAASLPSEAAAAAPVLKSLSFLNVAPLNVHYEETNVLQPHSSREQPAGWALGTAGWSCKSSLKVLSAPECVSSKSWPVQGFAGYKSRVRYIIWLIDRLAIAPQYDTVEYSWTAEA